MRLYNQVYKVYKISISSLFCEGATTLNDVFMDREICIPYLETSKFDVGFIYVCRNEREHGDLCLL